MKKSIHYLSSLKDKLIPIAMLTCYDYPSAVIQDAVGVDVLLVGDSVGTNILGYKSVQEVRLEDMTHHTKAVSRGASSSYVLADMPYATYQNPEQAHLSASALISSGASGVKVEGPCVEIVEHLTSKGIEVCAHLGFTPQTDTQPGIKAKSAKEADKLLNDAKALEEAGAKWIVLEMIPKSLAKAVTEYLRIPTIGIGAGPFVDGQVLVLPDLLGITEKNFRHNKKYLELRGAISDAVARYVLEVKNGVFPGIHN